MKSFFKPFGFKKLPLRTAHYFEHKETILIVLSFFIICLVLVLLYWIYIFYFKVTMTEGFSQSLLNTVNIGCQDLASDLKEYMDDPSNNDLSNNQYHIQRLLKKTTVKESVLDLSFQLHHFTNTYCVKDDCSGIPHEVILDISENITKIGEILKKIDKTPDNVITDFSNVQQFYQLTFNCSGGICE